MPELEGTPVLTPPTGDTGNTQPTNETGEVFSIAGLTDRWTKTDTASPGAFSDVTGAGIRSTFPGGTTVSVLTSLFEPFNPLGGGLAEITGNFRVASGMGFALGLWAAGTSPFASPVTGVYVRLDPSDTTPDLITCVASTEDVEATESIVLGVNHAFKLTVQSHRGNGIGGVKLWIDGRLVGSLDETISYPTGELRLGVAFKGTGDVTLYETKMTITGGVR